MPSVRPTAASASPGISILAAVGSARRSSPPAPIARRGRGTGGATAPRRARCGSLPSIASVPPSPRLTRRMDRRTAPVAASACREARPSIALGALGAAARSCAAAAAAAPSRSARSRPYDGTNPFSCEIQDVGTGTDFPDPDADPFCVEFDKTNQNITDFGHRRLPAQEPARVAAAADKCFYFQRDHWTGSIVQGEAARALALGRQLLLSTRHGRRRRATSRTSASSASRRRRATTSRSRPNTPRTSTRAGSGPTSCSTSARPALRREDRHARGARPVYGTGESLRSPTRAGRRGAGAGGAARPASQGEALQASPLPAARKRCRAKHR